MRNSKSYLFEVIYEIFSKEIRLFFFFKQDMESSMGDHLTNT